MTDIDLLVNEAMAEMAAKLHSTAVAKRGQIDGMELFTALRSRPEYPQISAALQRRLSEAKTREDLGAAAAILSVNGDFDAILASAERGSALSEDNFFVGFAEYCRSWISNGTISGAMVSGQQHFGTDITLTFPLGIFLTMKRGAWPGAVQSAAGRWDAGGSAFAADLDPVRNHIVVGLIQANQLAILDGTTLRPVRMIDFPNGGVRGVTVLPKLRRAYVATQYYHAVHVIDLDSLEMIATIPDMPARPERLTADPETGVVLVGCLGDDCIAPWDVTYLHERDLLRPTKGPRSNAVALVDAHRQELMAYLPTGRRPTAITISPELVAMGNFYDNSLTIFRRDALDKPATLAIDLIPNLTVSFANPTRPSEQLSKVLRPRGLEGIAVARRRGKILVTGYDMPVLMVVDVAKMAIENVILTGNQPFDVDIDADERYAYINCRVDGQVGVVDIEAGREVARLEGGTFQSDLKVVGDRLLLAHGAGLTVHDLGRRSW